MYCFKMIHFILTIKSIPCMNCWIFFSLNFHVFCLFFTELKIDRKCNCVVYPFLPPCRGLFAQLIRAAAAAAVHFWSKISL